MARFKESDITQGQFIAVNLSEQLIPGTFEWTLNYLIDKMDLSLFEEKYNNDEKGASAYQPKALLKIILLLKHLQETKNPIMQQSPLLFQQTTKK